jgi:hypothetical protein
LKEAKEKLEKKFFQITSALQVFIDETGKLRINR